MLVLLALAIVLLITSTTLSTLRILPVLLVPQALVIFNVESPSASLWYVIGLVGQVFLWFFVLPSRWRTHSLASILQLRYRRG